MRQNQHKILLIAPPFYRLYKDAHPFNTYLPLSLGYLAGTIEKKTNWKVIVYYADFYPENGGFSLNYFMEEGYHNYINNLKHLSSPIWREIKSTILEYKPTVVGISANTQNFLSACAVAKLTKDINRQIIVIVGGPHPSLVGSDVLNCPDLDVGVSGEGEKTIVELLNAIDAKKEFHDIRGISYRRNGQIIENEPRELIGDLDSLCFPHEIVPRVLKDYDRYPLNAFGHVLATRGCPYNCFFCGSHKIWSGKVRYRSPENVIREIKGLQKIGIDTVRFEDDIFGVTKRYIKDLCNALIAHCPGIKWDCEMHVKLVDDNTISLMKRAGCKQIQLGIESGNNEILRKIGKNITIEEALSACKIIRKHNIMLETFFMTGFPQETEKTLKETMAAMKKTKSDFIVYSVFTPYPGTEAFKVCKENGSISNNYDISLYNHQSPANYFCVNIPREKFRMLLSKIEKMVDRINYHRRKKNSVLRLCRLQTFRKVREQGLANSLQKGVRLLIGKS